MLSQTEKIVISSLQLIYTELGIDSGIDKDTIIYGPSDGINSLSLVRLIVEIEEAVLETLGKNIVLADDRSLSMKNSPFYSVGTLTEYINSLINE
jgi:acyl carrier protein